MLAAGVAAAGRASACAERCPTQAITYEDTAPADWIGGFAAERTARLLTAGAA